MIRSLNLLTIEEDGLTFITDLSDLQDTDTDTVIVDVTYDGVANTLSVLDSGPEPIRCGFD